MSVPVRTYRIYIYLRKIIFLKFRRSKNWDLKIRFKFIDKFYSPWSTLHELMTNIVNVTGIYGRF